MKTQVFSFPETIGVFVYKKHLKRLPSRSGYVDFALYESVFGEKAFAKRVMKKKFHPSTSLLKKEAKYLTALQSVIHRTKRLTPKHLSGIEIPRVLAFVEEKDFSILLTSFVNGKNTSKQDNSQVGLFPKVFIYLDFLYSRMTEKEKSVYSRRAGWFIVLAFPYLLAKAWLINPEFHPLLRRGLLTFIQGITSVVKKKAQYFSHRDIHGRNILQHEGMTYLVDFSYASSTVPNYDPISTLSSVWDNYSLRSEIFSYLAEETGRDIFNDSYLKALMVYVATLFLTSKNFSSQKKENYRQLLSFATANSGSPDLLSFSFIRKLLSIIPAYLHSSIKYAAGQKKISEFPEYIGSYKLKELLSTKKRYPYTVAIYTDASGNEVIGKVWSGRRYSVHAFNLLHEAIVYKTLTTIQERIKDIIPSHLRNISIPAYVDHIIQKDSIGVFMQRAEGRPITRNKDVEKIFLSHKKVREYLHFLGDHATENERSTIGVKSRSYYLSVYPFILAVACMRHVSHIKELGLGIYSVLCSLNRMTGDAITLTHGDLHTDNILAKRDKLTIVDLEQVTFTFNEFDTTAALSSRRSSLEFRNLLKHEVKQQTSDRAFAERFAGVGAFVSTFNLTSNLSAAHTTHYESILKFSNQCSVETGKHNIAVSSGVQSNI